MKRAKFPRVDRRVFAVTTLDDDSGDKRYWLSKTPLERLAAVELMRQMIYGYNPLTTRLQRVLEITQRA